MYWEIHPPRPERFPKGVDFAPRDPRDFPRAKPEGNLERFPAVNIFLYFYCCSSVDALDPSAFEFGVRAWGEVIPTHPLAAKENTNNDHYHEQPATTQL